MKISIITPVYNGARFIKETIESVLQQAGDFDLEYIVVDGASTDGTLSIISDYKLLVEHGYYKKYRQNTEMIVVSENDSGMYDALVKGFERSTGDLIAYINSDDFYMPNAFKAAISIFTANPEVAFFHANSIAANENGEIVNVDSYLLTDANLVEVGAIGGVFSKYHIPQESTFWRRELLSYVDYEKLRSLKLAGDFYLWYSFVANVELYAAQTFIGVFRLHNDNLSRTNGEAYHEEVKAITMFEALPAILEEKLKSLNYVNGAGFDIKLSNGMIGYDMGKKQFGYTVPYKTKYNLGAIYSDPIETENTTFFFLNKVIFNGYGIEEKTFFLCKFPLITYYSDIRQKSTFLFGKIKMGQTFFTIARPSRNAKKLSIITICYNESDVEKTCESIVKQRWQNFEWIFIDGGSDEWCLNILKKYEDKMKYFVSEKDNGLYDAMNKGIDHADGEYLIFMNAGDSFHDEEVLFDVFEKNNFTQDIIYGNEARIHENGEMEYIHKKFNFNDPYFWCYQYQLRHQASFIKKELFDVYGNYDLKYKSASDFEMFLRFLYIHKASSIYYDRYIDLYKCYGGLSSTAGWVGVGECYEIEVRYGLIEKLPKNVAKRHSRQQGQRGGGFIFNVKRFFLKTLAQMTPSKKLRHKIRSWYR